MKWPLWVEDSSKKVATGYYTSLIKDGPKPVSNSPVKTDNIRSITGYDYTWDDYIIIIIIIPVFMYRNIQQMPGMIILLLFLCYLWILTKFLLCLTGILILQASLEDKGT